MEEFLAAEKRVSIASYGESCVLPPGGLVLYSVYSPRLYCLCMNCIYIYSIMEMASDNQNQLRH